MRIGSLPQIIHGAVKKVCIEFWPKEIYTGFWESGQLGSSSSAAPALAPDPLVLEPNPLVLEPDDLALQPNPAQTCTADPYRFLI